MRSRGADVNVLSNLDVAAKLIFGFWNRSPLLFSRYRMGAFAMSFDRSGYFTWGMLPPVSVLRLRRPMSAVIHKNQLELVGLHEKGEIGIHR